jgi:integrase/recombinase XerD
MAITKPTATLFLDTRRALKTGKYPVKLTIYNQGLKKRYKLPIGLTEDEWGMILPKIRTES